MPGQRRSDGVGVFVNQLDQHHVARVPLHQSCNLAVVIAKQQIALPMARHCSILYAGWALANGQIRPWIGVFWV